jgi:vibriolysin
MRKTLFAALVAILAGCGNGQVGSGAGGINAVGNPKDQSSVGQALLALPDAHVTHWHADNLPGHVMGNLGHASSDLGRAVGTGDLQAALVKIAPVFRIDAQDLQAVRKETDDLGITHVRYQQFKNGLPVVGGDLAIHIAPDGRIYGATANARDGFDVPATPTVTESDALASATSAYADAQATVSPPKLTYLFTSGENALVLAWEMEAVGNRNGMPVVDRVFVDAHTGAVVDRHPQIFSALNRADYSANHGSTLPGSLVRGEGAPATGDLAADDAYDYVGATYNYYKTLFNRDSYDNAGAQLVSTVHFQQNYDNAYWNGSQMVYGDGDGTTFKPLSEALDVTAHELTHAVTANTANLTYSGESGGLNEAMSDIMGNTTETWSKHGDVVGAYTWQVGEDIYLAGGALRYMDDPAKDGSSLDYYPNYNSSIDVHYSSGIANLAYKLLVTGGTHPRNKTTVQVTGVGLDKARRIFYRALTTYFNANTNFAAAAAGTKQAALDLYDPATATSVEQAWAAVGVGSVAPPPSTGTTTLQNGVAVTFAGATGSNTYFKLVVPAGATSLNFAMSGGTGDADLYVKFGAAPTSTSYDCRPYLSGNNESCPIASASAGTYYVMVNAYQGYSGVSLVGSFSTSSGTASTSTTGTTSTSSTSGTTGTTSTSSTSGTTGTTSTSSTSGTTGGGNVLQNGVPVTNLSGATNAQRGFTINVPAGATNLKFAMSGGSGDADLYVRFGSAPTLTTFDCRPYLTGNNESCTIATAQGGTYYVMINGYQAYAGVSLVATYTSGGGTSGGGTTGGGTTGGGSGLQNGVPVSNLSGATGSNHGFTFDVPASAASVTIQIAGGTGDADLYVRFGAAPTGTVFDCRPYLTGNNETCTVTAQPGTYFINLNAYQAYGGVTLTASYQ